MLKYSINQEQVAYELGVTFATLNRWLNGKSKPRDSALNKMIIYIENFETNNLEKNYDIYLNNFSQFDTVMLSENELKLISKLLKESKNLHEILFELISINPDFGKNYDWNIGSLIQHFDAELIIDALKKIENLPKYYNSIGLCWVLGELNRKDNHVLNFLYAVLRYSINLEAMWSDPTPTFENLS